MQLHKVGKKFILDSTFEERVAPKTAGFRWDPDKRKWWTARSGSGLG